MCLDVFINGYIMYITSLTYYTIYKYISQQVSNPLIGKNGQLLIKLVHNLTRHERIKENHILAIKGRHNYMLGINNNNVGVTLWCNIAYFENDF